MIQDNSITKYELFHTKNTEVTAVSGEYGSVAVYLTDIKVYTSRTRHYCRGSQASEE